MSSPDEDILNLPRVERLRTAVRERPVADIAPSSVQIQLQAAEDNLVAYSPGSHSGLSYKYDYLYPQGSTQDDLFHTIGLEMVDVVMGGLSSSCVTMGFADTGKTHTLFGSENESGLILDTTRELFRRLEDATDMFDYSVLLRYWEMNRDTINDNLSSSAPASTLAASASTHEERPAHAVFRDRHGRVRVSNLTEAPLTNFEEFEFLLNEGNAVRIRRGLARMARWHGFVQVEVSTTDRAKGEHCVVRTMSFVHMKGQKRVAEDGARGSVLREGNSVNVSTTLLRAGAIHSVEFREKRMSRVRTHADLHRLIQESESFFMECKFSQVMSQLICGHEACIVLGCVDCRNYHETIETLETLELFRQLTAACVPIITASPKGVLLRRLRDLEGQFGTPEEVQKLFLNTSGRPRTEEEERLLQLRRQIDGCASSNQTAVARAHEEEMKQRNREHYQDGGVRPPAVVDPSPKRQLKRAVSPVARNGDRHKINLNAAKTATYEGQWADGMFDGFGEHMQSNFKYRGEFRANKREGEGSLFVRTSPTAPYKRVYEGEWRSGLRDGQGTQWSSNGEVYVGGFVAGRRQGRGVLYLTNGDVIEGDFNNDLCEGWAVLRMANGDWFEGNWLRGMREGPGVWHYSRRQQCLRGEWSKNTARLGTIEDEEEKVDTRAGGFIPRIGLDYQGVLAKERDLLNERRKREFAAEGVVLRNFPLQADAAVIPTSPATDLTAAANM